MATALKVGLEESIHDLACRIVVDESTRQYEHVGIVVLASQLGHISTASARGWA